MSKHMARWTPDELRVLRAAVEAYNAAGIGKMQCSGRSPFPAVAKSLSRSLVSVRCAAQSHGWTVRRFLTADELEQIRQCAQTPAPGEIARLAQRLGTTIRTIYNARFKLRQTRVLVKRGASFDVFLREKHALGWSDGEIAAAWTRLVRIKNPECQPAGRHSVGVRRKKLGLPDNRESDHLQNRVREKTREQLDRSGLDSLAELRSSIFRQRARAAGWPEELRPREVAILNAIWDRGPMTRPQIAEAIGSNWNGSRKSLKCSGRHGSYLACLIARGLVFAIPRAQKVRGRGKGKSMNIYSLSLDIARRKPA